MNTQMLNLSWNMKNTPRIIAVKPIEKANIKHLLHYGFCMLFL